MHFYPKTWAFCLKDNKWNKIFIIYNNHNPGNYFRLVTNPYGTIWKNYDKSVFAVNNKNTNEEISNKRN